VVALRNTKLYKHLSYSYISSKIVPLCNYTVLSATIKVLETLVVAILWKSFQHLRRNLDDVSDITKAPSQYCWSQSREQVKNSWNQSEGYGGYPSVVTLFFAKIKSLTKHDRCAGTLPWRRNQLLALRYSGRFLLTPSLRRRRISLYFFNHSSISCKLYQQILGTFWSYCLRRFCKYFRVYIRLYVSVCICTQAFMLQKSEDCTINMKSTGIIDLTTCMLVELNRSFGGTYCHNLPGTPNFAFNVVCN
jgi:hypothetical protein